MISNKIIAITPGDPEGIGPEVISSSLARVETTSSLIVFGNPGLFPAKHLTEITDVGQVEAGGRYLYCVAGDNGGAEFSFSCVQRAVDLVFSGDISAIVTGPISKTKWQQAGINYNGHTEYLAHRTGRQNITMFFWSPDIKVALFTVHCPLASVPPRVLNSTIVPFIRRVDSELRRLFKRRFNYRICGLNPHAGENGYMGREEVEEIIPAIETLRGELSIDGPFPPDSITLHGGLDPDCVIIAWYHDQGLIPFKLINRNSGVNLTLGLPFIRTSPDHGTAYDIAGRGLADPASMLQAIRLADELLITSSG